jgi:hypothetical protein
MRNQSTALFREQTRIHVPTGIAKHIYAAETQATAGISFRQALGRHIVDPTLHEICADCLLLN